MEKLRACIFSFCIACIVVGILERIAMSRRRFSVIKLVGTLYILITVLAPLREVKTIHWAWEVPTASSAAETPDTAQLVLTAAENALAKQVEQALDTAGIPFHSAKVILKEQEGTVQLCRVIVTLPQGTDEQAAAQAAVQVLGTSAPVEVRGEGT